MSVDAWIASQAQRATLGAQALRIIQVLSSQPRFASYATAREIADRAGVNISTVTRTAQSLGFAGWPGLQLELRNRYLASLSASEVLAEHADPTADPVVAALQRDAENLALAARSMDLDAVRAIAGAIRTAGRTLVIGSGSYLAPGMMLGHIGALMGLDIECDPVGGTHRVTRLARLTAGDCLVVFNVWRLPREILELTRIARERGVTTCVVTDRRGTPFTAAGDHVLVVPSEGSAHFPSLTASMAVVHAILAQIVADHADGVSEATTDFEALCRRLDLMAEQPAHPEQPAPE